MLPKSADASEVRETIMEEVISNYETDVKDVSDKIYYQLGGSNARDGKITVLYMYENESVDFVYKAVSTDPDLQNDYVFMALDGPTEEIK